jgi:hypothetical protein
MHVFAEIYGRQPAWVDFNPGLNDVEAYLRFHDDRCWPSGATVIRHWGTWNAAIEAAGFEPIGPGKQPNHRDGTKTHCKHGHEFTPENTHISIRRGRPVRICRTCQRAANNARYARRVAGPGSKARRRGEIPLKGEPLPPGRPKEKVT